MNFPPIQNAGNTLLSANPGTLPDMSTGMLNWFAPVQYIQVVKTIVNFQVYETYTPSAFQGVVYPAKSRDLQQLPEGQRAWSWFSICALPTLQLKPDDIIWIGNTRYRIMGQFDWSQYGFMEYRAIQDYQDMPFAPPLPNQDGILKSVVDLTFTAPLFVTVTLTSGVEDATAAEWRLYDHNLTQYTDGEIEVIDDTHVKVTVSATGNYRLIGVQ